MSTNTEEEQTSRGRPRPPIDVPPAYPDQESWRQFGLYRRQLRRSELLRKRDPHALASAAV